MIMMKKNKLTYEKVNEENFVKAYNIQKTIWENEPDYENFVSKVNENEKDNVSWIVLLEKKPIGITGIYTEQNDKETIWLDWFGILPEYRRRGFGKRVLLDTIEYCKKLKKYEYLRLDTTYWDGRPVIYLYDEIMTFKERYTIEDKDNPNNWWIYTYSLNGKKEKWNNKYLGLIEYYEKCKNKDI